MILKYKNINVHYTDEGKGSVLVFLHGFLENLSIWKPFVNSLTPYHQVVCIDLLGHGKTECLGYIHTMETMAEVVHAVLENLNLEQAIFLGHSMGGYVALAYAEKYPDSVLGLCLANSTSYPDSEEKRKMRDKAIGAVKQNHTLFIKLSIANLFAEHNRERFKNEIETLKKDALKMPLQGIVAALEGMKIRPSRVDLLKNTPYKKMLIVGKKDPVLNYEDSLEQVKETAVKLVEFPDGHMSFIENKTQFEKAIKDFCAKL